MPLASKQKRKIKSQSRELDGKFGSKKSKIEVNSDVEIDLNLLNAEVSNFQTLMDNDMEEIELQEDEWGDDEDSGWESDLDLEQEKKCRDRLISSKLELTWTDNNELEKKKRGLYMKGKVPKSTFYDKWGPNGLFTKAAASANKITTYFPVHNNPSSEINENLELTESSNESDDNIWSNNIIDKKIEDLKVELDKGHNMVAGEYNKKRSIYEYLKSVKKDNGNKVKSSLEVAKLVYVDGGPWKACQIRKITNYWLRYNKLPLSNKGKHQKTIRLVDDEDIAEKCQSWAHQQNFNVTAPKFKEYIEQDLLPNIGIAKKKTISLTTARRWLNILGYSYQRYHLGIYYDGHERDDVIQYRKKFLEEIFEHEKFMSKYEGENMDRVQPNLTEGEKERILVTHDECIFYSNDGKRGIWAKDGEMPLRKKGNGRSILVSEFLTEINGRLQIPLDEVEKYPSIPKEARCYLKPGKNREGYWTSEHLLQQIEQKAIPIFEALYPNCIAVFAFDNSSNHAAFSQDALVASRMNLGPGGKQPKMRQTFFGPNNQPQDMVFPGDYPVESLCGKPKGMKQILIERGKWHEGLLAECKNCKKKVADEARMNCCARKIIFLEPDFQAQKGAIQELIERAGHKCIFYPKFHCELNFIERYWGAAKRHARENCNYSWTGLQETVPQSLDAVPLITIRRFAQKAWRYMDLYRHGIGGKLAEYAVRKYRSHRKIPDGVLKELEKTRI